MNETAPGDHPTWWCVHDLVVGSLAGTAMGLVAGVFVASRTVGPEWVILIGAGLGVVVCVFALLRSHDVRDQGITPSVVIVWLLGLASVVVVIGLIAALNALDTGIRDR